MAPKMLGFLISTMVKVTDRGHTWPCNGWSLRLSACVYLPKLQQLTIQLHIKVESRLPNGGDEDSEAIAIAKSSNGYYGSDANVI